MAPRDWTGEELDRLAGAYYEAVHDDDCSAPWVTLPTWRRMRHRRGVRALLAERAAIVDEQMAAFRASRRRTIALIGEPGPERISMPVDARPVKVEGPS